MVKRFGDAGLRDILVQSEVLSEGSVDRALTGKMYNRSVRSVKIVFEALSRILIDQFHEKLDDDVEKKAVADNVINNIQDLCSNLNQDNFEDFIVSDSFSTYATMWIDYLDDLAKNGGELACFWLSFLEMARILLNLLCATRAGLWDLFLETIRDIIPYTFAYDNINYSRYLTVMLGDMTSIETKFPNVYQEFKHGNFTAQLKADHPFARMEPDKIIECTINKDTKTPGGTTGFSTKSQAVMRWTLNASYRADLRKNLYGFIDYAPQNFEHKDLRQSRIARDEKDVSAVINIFENIFINPFSQNQLLCISNGLVATQDVKKDLLGANERGKAAMEKFVQSRLSPQPESEFFTPIKKLSPQPESEFFTPIKKLKLKSFGSMRKTVKVTVKNKQVPVKSHSDLFGQLALIMQTRTVDLRDVFTYPLGPHPWSLAGVMGGLRKSNKALLLHMLEKDVDPVEDVEGDTIVIVDGMAVVQKTRICDKTFGQLSECVLRTVVNLGKHSAIIHLVFDVYRNESIKNAERNRRGEGNLLFQSLISSQPVKQWNLFLTSSQNKRELINFFVDEWKVRAAPVIGNKVLYVAFEDKCLRFSGTDHVEQTGLESNQEEADTRMLLHMKCEGNNDDDNVRNKKFIVHTPDTDVLILCLGHLHNINGDIFIRTSTGDHLRTISIQKIKDKLENQIGDLEVSPDDLCEALIGYHSFTGCDSVSAFAGKGKKKPWKIVLNSTEYVKAFKNLGTLWHISVEQLEVLEMFVCNMYCKSGGRDVNEFRYKIYCTKRGKLTCDDLPHVNQHWCNTANKQIIKHAFGDEPFKEHQMYLHQLVMVGIMVM